MVVNGFMKQSIQRKKEFISLVIKIILYIIIIRLLAKKSFISN